LGEEAARRVAWDDLENVVVDVEITDWPTATQNPRGRVVEILGYEDDFGADVEIMIRKHHLPHRFPPAVSGRSTGCRAHHSSLGGARNGRDFPRPSRLSPSTEKPRVISTTL
jgi:ribonuclease R